MTTATTTDHLSPVNLCIAAAIASGVDVRPFAHQRWLAVRTPNRRAAFVDLIKQLPVSDRSWHKEKKVWLVKAIHADTVSHAVAAGWPEATETTDVKATAISRRIVKTLKQAGTEKGEYGSWTRACETNSRFSDIVEDVDAAAEKVSTLETERRADDLRSIDRGRLEACDLDMDVMPQETSGPCVRALKAAGGDITIELVEPRYEGSQGSMVIPMNASEHRLIVDADTKRIFGAATDMYNTPQHRDVATMLDAAIEGANGALEGAEVSCRTANHGAKVWWLADLKHFSQDDIITPEVKAKVQSRMDEYGGQVSAGGSLIPTGLDFSVKLVASNSVDGQPLTWSLMMDVEACSNKARVAVAGMCGSLKHTKRITDRVQAMTAVFRHAEDLSLGLRDMVGRLAMTEVDAETLDTFAEAMFPSRSKVASPQTAKKRAGLKDLYYNADGAAPGTAWGLVQSVTNYTTHHKAVSVNGRSSRRFSLEDTETERIDQAREYSSMWGSGHTLNTKALEYVLDMSV